MTLGPFIKISKEVIQSKLIQEAPSNALWIFDCDGTLINSDIAELTAWGLLRSGLAHPDHLPSDWSRFSETPLDWPSYCQIREKIIDERGTHGYFEWEILLHSGLPTETVFQIATLAIQEAQLTGRLHFTSPLSQIAQRVKNQAWIVSGSPYTCVAAIAQFLGLSTKRIIATHLESVDGIFSPRLKEPGIIWEQLKKEEILRLQIGKPWIVCGDSIGDWAMMELASHYVWCVVWDEHRHRGLQFRGLLQDHFGDLKIPQDPGIYLSRFKERNWIVEVKDPHNI